MVLFDLSSSNQCGFMKKTAKMRRYDLSANEGNYNLSSGRNIIERQHPFARFQHDFNGFSNRCHDDSLF